MPAWLSWGRERAVSSVGVEPGQDNRDKQSSTYISARLAELLADVSEPFVTMDSRQSVLLMNESMRKRFGIGSGVVAGQPMTSVFGADLVPGSWLWRETIA
ncbi:hypothetical protein [Marinobacter changyiensis]|uniref:hypothetical protein n=1 Tax=Marinobacter changyiensis TaxID=2604091 RepID=UPI0012653B5D|nr:hypothetical protein [Marinobacter changyiensis]